LIQNDVGISHEKWSTLALSEILAIGQGSETMQLDHFQARFQSKVNDYSVFKCIIDIYILIGIIRGIN
jgi:hypothetical protein